MGYDITQGKLFHGDAAQMEDDVIKAQCVSTIGKLRIAFPEASIKFIKNQAPTFWCLEEVNQALNKLVLNSSKNIQPITLPDNLSRMALEGDNNLQFLCSGSEELENFLRGHLNWASPH